LKNPQGRHHPILGSFSLPATMADLQDATTGAAAGDIPQVVHHHPPPGQFIFEANRKQNK
jgi:hypothetical protein